MRAVLPTGVKRANIFAAPPVNAMVGLPEGSFTTPKSFMKTPCEKPVPKALEQASLAQKRFAYDAARMALPSDLRCSIAVKLRWVKRVPQRSNAFSMRRISTISLPMPMIISSCLYCRVCWQELQPVQAAIDPQHRSAHQVKSARKEEHPRQPCRQTG